MPDALRIHITDNLHSPNPTDPQPALFAHLKSQILSNALALYGASRSSPTPPFDIITYTTPLPPSLQILLNGRSDIPSTLYGAALITYTSPGEFTSWERLATVENSGGFVAAMRELLADVQAGVGGVMLWLSKDGATQSTSPERSSVVNHAVVPGVVDGVSSLADDRMCTLRAGNRNNYI